MHKPAINKRFTLVLCLLSPASCGDAAVASASMRFRHSDHPGLRRRTESPAPFLLNCLHSQMGLCAGYIDSILFAESNTLANAVPEEVCCLRYGAEYVLDKKEERAFLNCGAYLKIAGLN